MSVFDAPSKIAVVHVPTKNDARNESACGPNDGELDEQLNNLKARYDQVRNELEQTSFQNRELFTLLTKYVDQLDDQVFSKEVLEVELDQHKEALAEVSKELAEKNCIIEAQEYLLLSAREETEKLIDETADKDHLISSLLAQPGQSGMEESYGERAKKRKIGW